MFQEGRALHQLGEYAQARQLLIRAQNMQPQNDEISNELRMLEERFKRYKQNEKDIWTKAMGIFDSFNKTQPKPNDEHEEFERCIMEVMQSFKDDIDLNKFDLPSGLTSNEIAPIQK